MRRAAAIARGILLLTVSEGRRKYEANASRRSGLAYSLEKKEDEMRVGARRKRMGRGKRGGREGEERGGGVTEHRGPGATYNYQKDPLLVSIVCRQ